MKPICEALFRFQLGIIQVHSTNCSFHDNFYMWDLKRLKEYCPIVYTCIVDFMSWLRRPGQDFSVLLYFCPFVLLLYYWAIFMYSFNLFRSQPSWPCVFQFYSKSLPEVLLRWCYKFFFLWLYASWLLTFSAYIH